MKNAMSKKVIAMVLLATTFGTTTVSAAEDISKKETVYINLDSTGSAQKTTVSDWIHNSSEDQLKIKDYSELDNIVNIKGNDKPEVNGKKLKWNISDSDLYYQGTIDKDLPLDVNIKYYLNGKKISAEDLAGQSGKVKIEISLKNNVYKDRNINGEMKRIYTIFSTGLEVMLPVDQFKSVKTSGGTLLSEGNNNIVTFVTFPGLKDSLGLNDKDIKDLGLNVELKDKLTIEAKVDKFSLQPIMIAASPEIPDLDKLNDAKSIDDIKNTLNDKLDALKDNYKLLLDGSKQISDGVNDGVNQASAMLNGSSELSTISSLITNDNKLNQTRKMMNDTKVLSAMDTTDAANAVKVLNRGNNKQQLIKLTQDMKLMNSYSGLLNGTMQLLNADNGALTGAAISTLNNYDSLSAEGKQVLSNLCTNLADYKKLKELQNLIRELKATKAGYGNTQNVLNMAINQQPGNSETEKIDNFFNGLTTSLDSAATLTSADTKNALAGISQDVTNYANAYMLVDAQIAYIAATNPTSYMDELNKLKAAVNVVYGQSQDAATKQLAQSINAYIDSFDPTKGFDVSSISNRVAKDGQNLAKNQTILEQLTAGLNNLSTLNPLLNALNADLKNTDTKTNTETLIGMLNQDDQMLDNLENAILLFNDADLQKLADTLSSLNSLNAECNKNQAVINNVKKSLSDNGTTISANKVNDLRNKVNKFAKDVNDSQDLINGFSSMLGTGLDKNKLDNITNMGTKLVSMQNDLKDSSELLRMANDALSDGNVKKARNLINSLPEINSKIKTLKDGTDKLYNGMKQYNDEGIQTIYDKGTTAAKDMDKVLAYKDAIVDQAKEYDTFAGKTKSMDGSVSFVMKTDTIKAPEKTKSKDTNQKKKGIIAWFKDLFGID